MTPPPRFPAMDYVQPDRLHAGLGEGDLVEDAALDLFTGLGWQTANLFEERFGPEGTMGRRGRRDVVLPKPLMAALARLNPGLDPAAWELAAAELTRDRSAMDPVAANREVWRLLRDGVPVRTRGPQGEMVDELVRLIDWRCPTANDFLLARQVWFASDLWERRADLVGFVNGIPLLFAELKGLGRPLRAAFDENLRDYRDTIPRLFDFNGITLLSNGMEAVIGASHGEFGHFKPWKRVADEGEEPRPGLETAIRAACTPDRLLDLIENFTAFEETPGGLVKKIAQNHQYLGVNKAVARLMALRTPLAGQPAPREAARLGVFWHTQGSGKSLSMLFFTEKIHRTLPGNWTFVILTDRTELDDQISATYAAAGAVKKDLEAVQAHDREHLKQLLRGDERYIFTLIQKFSTAGKGEVYPRLSDRSDIIVITDEAHRSQYDQLALNLRRALPNAAFLGFTGTPLMEGDQPTREVFGDYVSIYDFGQSVEDEATVPLYYEKRVPEVHIINDSFKEELQDIIDDAALDEDQERQLGRSLGTLYQLITNPDRLDKIAADLVRHFAGRGYRGKAMVVGIDKATAVQMHDLVRKHWDALITAEAAKLAHAPADQQAPIADNLAWLRETDMAVIVSQGQNEVAELAARGLDIRPHRARMQAGDLDADFKKPDHPLRLVFVCAMWITGFDVPTCSTIYIDKPMRNHTLMQTIARANRRAPGKEAGLIVDYVGVFANLQKALALYARPKQGGGDDRPIEDKAALVAVLRDKLSVVRLLASAAGAGLDAIWTASKLDRLARVKAAADALIHPENRRQAFLAQASLILRLYKAILPDEAASDFTRDVAAVSIVADTIRASIRPDPAELARVRAEIAALIERSIAGIDIEVPVRGADDLDELFDLSSIDFEKLAGKLSGSNRRSKAEALIAAARAKVAEMAAANPSRRDLADKLEQLIADYNANTVSLDELFDRLLDFVRELDEETRRSAREQLSEDELAVFDLLVKPGPTLSRAEIVQVKRVARDLLARLKRETAILDWWRKPSMRDQVRIAIEEELDKLPEAFIQDIWERKVQDTFRFVYERQPTMH
ncbi:type I restriction endonuclease subunit R [Niveispirillum irakense]|uniref:type I restriction endonuclease subunit R n=1 Tax=Niveispirillum irakense TaxID=34011 RepID=UPI0003FCB964|nr:type I restriction endonuclease subunit R [Niveispirillum irakense]